MINRVGTNFVAHSEADGTQLVPATLSANQVPFSWRSDRNELDHVYWNELSITRGDRLLLELPGHELVGQRSVETMASAELVDLWCRITSRIVKYGFAVRYEDLEPPRTGIFDGLTITLDPDVGFEMQCFILLHLFGHSIQWVAPSLEHKLGDLQHTKDLETFLKVLRAYEFEAARIGMTLLHESGVKTLDQWYSDFVETDWRYVRHYYTHGVIPDWNDCRAQACEIIEPLSIPPITLRQVAVRFAF